MNILLLNQCFYPDVVSTAQHLTDLATALHCDGHRVTVFTSRRGYDDPSRMFAKRETYQGVNIRRVSTLNLGKQSRWRRALNFSSFLFNCAARLLVMPQQDVVIALTSPPLISVLGSLFVKLKGGRFYFWVMDLNPDEAIAAGWLKEYSITARLLKALLNFSIRQAEKIFVLDRFMKDRVIAKAIPEQKIVVVPPWSHDDSVQFDPDGRERLRRTHAFTEKFVVMYSGNHSPCHPLDTLLQAAEALRGDDHIRFCFVGGGSERGKVERFGDEHQLKNILCLPYQTRQQLSASLSAADLHVVVMGDPFVGIVHPCKIYNILKVGAPVLYIGPSESHVTDIFSQANNEVVHYEARHEDVRSVVNQISVAADAGRKAYASSQVSELFSAANLIPQITSALLTDRRIDITAVAESPLRVA